MDTHKLSRREFIERALALGAVAVGAGVVLQGCSKPLDCSDTTGLSADDAATRTNNGYVEATTTPGQTCANCQLYTAGAANACGGCTVVKGPINPSGWCRIWVQRA